MPAETTPNPHTPHQASDRRPDWFTPQRATLEERVFAAGVVVLCAALILTAAWLSPDPAGHGTHTQLGLPKCGWYAATGQPCPTCGMTTAVTLAVHARPFSSLLTQPFGTLIAISAAVGFWVGLHVLIFGSRVGRPFAKLLRPKALWIIAALWGLSWGYTALKWNSVHDRTGSDVSAPRP